ncbi:hypothetical protein [Streptomyces cadmiisoli]|uniref:hypothetical protein n=1 Tax=Streptomyces cadmiisoli TaxID=2184053 RepID=UPI00364EE136
MTIERGLANFRQWALSVVDLLGADPDRQTAFMQESRVGADEILLQFDDLLHVASARADDGSLKHEDHLLIKSIKEGTAAVSNGPDSIWTVEAIEESAEWRDLRVVARVAKARLERSWAQESDE